MSTIDNLKNIQPGQCWVLKAGEIQVVDKASYWCKISASIDLAKTMKASTPFLTLNSKIITPLDLMKCCENLCSRFEDWKKQQNTFLGVINFIVLWVLNYNIAIDYDKLNQLRNVLIKSNMEERAFCILQERLRKAPGFSGYPKLEYISLIQNQLKEPPDLSYNTNLKTLEISFNQLTQPPDLSNNTQLQRVNLSSNQLTQPPNLSSNIQLEDLNLSSNQLTELPNLSNSTQLQRVNLSSNQLTQPPNLSNNTQLERLALDYNQLTQAPDLSNNTQLQQVNLCNNQLRELPDSILSLPAACAVNVENNLFSAAYVQTFQERLHAHRRLHPGQGPRIYFSIHDTNPVAEQNISLTEELNFWSKEFEDTFPNSRLPIEGSQLQGRFSNLFSLTPSKQTLLAKYLHRLKSVKDYITEGKSRENIIVRVENMLQLATNNTEFKDGVLGVLEDGLAACHDRVMVFFNDIEILWQFHAKPLSQQEFRELAIRAERYRQLTFHVQNECKRLNLQDQVETILYFQIKLKEALSLPINTENMLYPGAAAATPDMLKQAKKKILEISNEDLLATSPFWHHYIEGKNKELHEQIIDKYQTLLVDLEDYFKLDNEKEAFLEDHLDLTNFLKEAANQKIQQEYIALVNFLDAERRREITKKFQDDEKGKATVFL